MKRAAIFMGLGLVSGIWLCATLTSAQETGAARPGEVKIFGGIEFVWIPPGTFTMGSKLSPDEIVAKYRGVEGGEEHEYDDESPLHSVTLSKGFWMSKYEITNAQYRRFKPQHSSKDYEGHSLDGDKQPVVHVHWTEAEAYCAWLSEHAESVFRLPTEAEWEYACRAGTETVRYWGDDNASMGQYENVRDRTGDAAFAFEYGHAAETTDGYKVTAPVGSFKPNAWGLHDMIGNAVEWCSDWYDESYYENSPTVDPTGPSSGQYRVLRGGSWNDVPADCRSAERTWIGPNVAYGGRGFRICK